MPLTVSVLLPAYNAASCIRGAMDSILRQTLRDFELIVIDDGSTDGTREVVEQYRDRRLVVLRKDTNEGLVAALNAGIDVAKGRYVARMDADDVAHGRRLELQARYLDQHPNIGICGSWFRVTGRRWPITVRTPVQHDDISARLFFRSPFAHPTIVFRRAFLQETRLRYDAASRDAEDFDLWVRARKHTRFANVPRVLLSYRLHSGQTSVRSLESQSKTVAGIRLNQLADLLPAATQSEKDLHLAVSAPYAFKTKEELIRARDWLEFLASLNSRRRLFSLESFAKALAHSWSYCCLGAAMTPHHIAPIYLSARFAALAPSVLQQHAAIICKLFLRPIAG